MAIKENVMLVDSQDRMTGTMDKLAAHKTGMLHRAFSIFIFNSKSELLLQQRALNKYHSGGLWTNTCCSHQKLGEDTKDAIHRRLEEEMGMCCSLIPAFKFQYRAVLSNGLIEHEYDHVWFGASDILPLPNPQEVASFKYISLEDLGRDLTVNPQHYTDWLKICFNQVVEYQKLFSDTRIINEFDSKAISNTMNL